MACPKQVSNHLCRTFYFDVCHNNQNRIDYLQHQFGKLPTAFCIDNFGVIGNHPYNIQQQHHNGLPHNNSRHLSFPSVQREPPIPWNRRSFLPSNKLNNGCNSMLPLSNQFIIRYFFDLFKTLVLKSAEFAYLPRQVPQFAAIF